jgi:hypothetical protein
MSVSSNPSSTELSIMQSLNQINSQMQTLNHDMHDMRSIIHNLEEKMTGMDVLHRKSNTPSSASGFDLEHLSPQARLNLLQSRERQLMDLRDCIQSVS